MKNLKYTTRGVCSRSIDITIGDDGKIEKVKFEGGCRGNTQGVAALAIGRSPDEVISILEGIKCGLKSTSCPDQLAKALKSMIEE